MKGNSDSRKCRLCFEDKKGLIYIFEVSQGDHFPPFVCPDCSDKLHEFKEFKKKCDWARETYKVALETKKETKVLKTDEDGDNDLSCVERAYPIGDHLGDPLADPISQVSADAVSPKEAVIGAKEEADEQDEGFLYNGMPFIVSVFPIEAVPSDQEDQQPMDVPLAEEDCPVAAAATPESGDEDAVAEDSEPEDQNQPMSRDQVRTLRPRKPTDYRLDCPSPGLDSDHSDSGTSGYSLPDQEDSSRSSSDASNISSRSRNRSNISPEGPVHPGGSQDSSSPRPVALITTPLGEQWLDKMKRRCLDLERSATKNFRGAQLVNSGVAQTAGVVGQLDNSTSVPAGHAASLVPVAPTATSLTAPKKAVSAAGTDKGCSPEDAAPAQGGSLAVPVVNKPARLVNVQVNASSPVGTSLTEPGKVAADIVRKTAVPVQGRQSGIGSPGTILVKVLPRNGNSAATRAPRSDSLRRLPVPPGQSLLKNRQVHQRSILKPSFQRRSETLSPADVLYQDGAPRLTGTEDGSTRVLRGNMRFSVLEDDPNSKQLEAGNVHVDGNVVAMDTGGTTVTTANGGDGVEPVCLPVGRRTRSKASGTRMDFGKSVRSGTKETQAAGDAVNGSGSKETIAAGDAVNGSGTKGTQAAGDAVNGSGTKGTQAAGDAVNGSGTKGTQAAGDAVNGSGSKGIQAAGDPVNGSGSKGTQAAGDPVNGSGSKESGRDKASKAASQPSQPGSASSDSDRDWWDSEEGDKLSDPFADSLEEDRRTEPQGRNEFLCEICGKVLSRYSSLFVHLRNHKGQLQFDCKQCPKTFNQKHRLEQHILSHKDERPFKCSECPKAFKCKMHLVQHHISHTGKRRYPCAHCEDSFRTRWQFKAHQKKHEGKVLWSCDCGEKCNTWDDLEKHQLEHKKNRTYKCDVCSKVFAMREMLQSHLLQHSKPYTCTVCNQSLSRKRDKVHHEAMHAGERNFQCDVCGSKFYTRNTMTKHRKEVHFDVQKFKCRFCTFRTKYKYELKKHEKRKHAKEVLQ